MTFRFLKHTELSSQIVCLEEQPQLYENRKPQVLVDSSKLAAGGKCPICSGQITSPTRAYCDLCGWTWIMEQKTLAEILQEVGAHPPEEGADGYV